ncbi:aminotransferase class IV [Rhodoligotrophos defluvii]|uniref:aminotransferase class IV n=1 Tax=Rhodoligotrophos defluvii TaxID=2561934 RepID=UPI0010C99A4C|nr:aminotransferase class IV [Rhodoligotrophos defluvii]
MSDALVHFGGKLRPANEATISVLSPSVKYGIGVFEGIRGYGDDGGEICLFRLDEHLARMIQSMTIMGYGELPTVAELRDVVMETVLANAANTDVHIRLAAYIVSQNGFVDAAGPVLLSCAVLPAKSKPPHLRAVTTCISSWRRIGDNNLPPRVKNSANYANGRLALLEARRHGYDEAILLTEDGAVSEAAAACLFAVRHGKLVTPAGTQSILESVTRDSLIQLAREVVGCPVEERAIDRTELLTCHEAFLCGSAYEVTPIKSVDQISLPGGAPGPISLALWEAYERAVHGKLDRFSHWVTRVGA